MFYVWCECVMSVLGTTKHSSATVLTLGNKVILYNDDDDDDDDDDDAECYCYCYAAAAAAVDDGDVYDDDDDDDDDDVLDRKHDLGQQQVGVEQPAAGQQGSTGGSERGSRTAPSTARTLLRRAEPHSRLQLALSPARQDVRAHCWHAVLGTGWKSCKCQHAALGTGSKSVVGMLVWGPVRKSSRHAGLGTGSKPLAGMLVWGPVRKYQLASCFGDCSKLLAGMVVRGPVRNYYPACWFGDRFHIIQASLGTVHTCVNCNPNQDAVSGGPGLESGIITIVVFFVVVTGWGVCQL